MSGTTRSAKQGRSNSPSRGRRGTETFIMGLMKRVLQAKHDGSMGEGGSEKCPVVCGGNRKNMSLTQHLFCDRHITDMACQNI
jgi:hypothetical protein